MFLIHSVLGTTPTEDVISNATLAAINQIDPVLFITRFTSAKHRIIGVAVTD